MVLSHDRVRMGSKTKFYINILLIDFIRSMLKIRVGWGRVYMLSPGIFHPWVSAQFPLWLPTNLRAPPADGFNEAKPLKRMVVVVVHLSRAFDTVNHDILLKKVSESPLTQT